METRITAFCLLISTIFLLGAGPVQYSEEIVTGNTQGNHDLNCTIITPWRSSTGPEDILYPVIVWANGWGWNDNAGDFTTDGYMPGLIEWALDGPYIVVAANQWSVQESDVLQCLEYVLDEYDGIANPERIGLAGHSQGGGAVIKADEGEPNGFEITAVVAMNPYGPGWVNPGNQDGPVMLIGGTEDTTTPTSSFAPVWEAIQINGIGGLQAELIGGTHNDDAWAPEGEDPTEYNFGRYQEVTELWWQFHLNDKAQSGRQLKQLLDREPWDTEYAL
jgi:dienelactone hydrolase